MATTTAPTRKKGTGPGKKPGGKKKDKPFLPPVKRRTFLRYAFFGGVSFGLAGFGAAALGQLWPNLAGGFGGIITMEGMTAEEMLAEIKEAKTPLWFSEGRMYIVAWDPSVRGAEEAYGEVGVALGPSDGLMALFQKCVHLGCRVPWCQTSQWFECPCHGSKYNKWGEWQDGPAPRGLDRFPAEINDAGNLVVNTGILITGPSRTADVLQQPPEGPNCIDL